MVEQPAVNRLVAGSNPARGAKLKQRLRWDAPPVRASTIESGAASIEIAVKRLTPLQRLRHMRIAKLRQRKRQKQRARPAALRDTESSKQLQSVKPAEDLQRITVYRRGRVRSSLARERKLMPANFCLEENSEEVAAFLNELRHRLTTGGEQLQRARMSGNSRRVAQRTKAAYTDYIDFATLDRITPSAALLLASEYDRANELYKFGQALGAINIERWKPAVLMTLQDLGFLSLLGVEAPKRQMIERNGVYAVPFLSGRRVLGEEIDRLIRQLAALAEGEGIAGSETLLSRSRVYDGLGEAIQNVQDHAYPDDVEFAEPPVKRWWMTGAVEPAKRRFNVVIYDQGVTIPISIPRWSLFRDFKTSFLNAVGREFDPSEPDKDGEAIAQAVQFGRSSTGKPWRGKGLPLMREIVENSAGGTLRIFSRRGEYVYRAGQEASCHSHTVSLSGTLVEWDLYL